MIERRTKQADAVDYHVGKRVQARRRETGISQTELADCLGVTFQQIQKYEKGRNRISAGRLFHIAEKLKVPVAYFYEAIPVEAISS